MKDFFLNYPENKLTKNLTCDVLKKSTALNYHISLREYSKTPLLRLKNLASKLGVSEIFVKDESKRFGLNTFKALGASYAIHKVLSKNPETATFCTATDGNHGMAVAWSSARHNKRSIIYVPKETSDLRIKTISVFASEVKKLDLDYEGTCEYARGMSLKMNWKLVQDTSWNDYEEIPAHIMSGYLTHFRELEDVINTVNKPIVDIVFFQCGVGSWAASGIWYYLNRYGVKRPKIILVEPTQSCGVLESFKIGDRVSPKGNFKTIMAGLNCGIPSKSAWEIIQEGCDAAISISDRYAERAIKNLYYPKKNDPKIISGESGAAGLAGLMKCMNTKAFNVLRNHVGLNSKSKIMIFNTEGDTDKESFKSIIKK